MKNKELIYDDWPQKLFNLMHDEHQLILLDSELQEIYNAIVVTFYDAETFDQVEPNQVMGQGEGMYPELHNERVKWIAIKGYGNDWAMYYHLASHTYDHVKQEGQKAFTENVVRHLVPCSDEVWAKYRA